MLIRPYDKPFELAMAVKRMPPLTVKLSIRHGANDFDCNIADRSEFCDERIDRIAVVHFRLGAIKALDIKTVRRAGTT